MHMPKRTFFIKNFVSYASIILIALVLAGMAFFYQVNQYSTKETTTQLQDLARNVSQQTTVVLDNYSQTLDQFYQLSLLLTARDSDISIIIADTQGQALFYTTPDGIVAREDCVLPTSVVQQMQADGAYTDISTLDNLFSMPNYVVGQRVTSVNGVQALVIVSTQKRIATGMLTQVMRSFVIIVSVALVGILMMAYVTSSRITRPMKSMSNAAKLFAQGDFSVRVPLANDCDEIDELAQAFNNMASSLEQLEELTRGFIGNVSHEFKTPMTTIGGFVDGMLDGTIAPAQHDKYLRIISEEVHRLSRMVMRMLDAAKIQSGELLLAPMPFDFSEMASQIILSFEQKLEAKQVEVSVLLEEKLMVQGDRDHVFRAVYNLVDNAVKFVDEGGSLRLQAAQVDGLCAFHIVNTGGGISPEDLTHIFDRFYKADPSRSRDRTGAGLGLYIVKNIINLHGGDISVRSDGGETEFAFTLPLAVHAKAVEKNF